MNLVYGSKTECTDKMYIEIAPQRTYVYVVCESTNNHLWAWHDIIYPFYLICLDHGRQVQKLTYAYFHVLYLLQNRWRQLHDEAAGGISLWMSALFSVSDGCWWIRLRIVLSRASQLFEMAEQWRKWLQCGSVPIRILIRSLYMYPLSHKSKHWCAVQIHTG